MFAYDKTFDPKVVLGQYDLISRFSDFPLYLGTQLVYEHTSFTICMSMTRPLTVKYSWVTVTLFHGSVILPYISTLSWYFFGSVILPLILHQGKKMYEHNAFGYWSGLALCLTMVRSSRARCPATALIVIIFLFHFILRKQ